MSAYRDVGLFVLLASTWGSAFAGIKIGIEYIPPLLFAAFRYDLAAAILFAYVVVTSHRVRPRGRAEWFDLCASGLFIVAALQGFLAYGEQFITSAIAAIIVSMGPIITTGLSRLALPEEGLSRTGILGLIVGFIGVGIVTRPSPDLLFAGEPLGKLSILTAVVCLSVGTVLTRVVAEDVKLPVSVREAWSMGIGAVALHVSSAAISEPISTVRFTGPGTGAVLYLAVIPSVIGYFIYFDLLDRRGAIEVNLVLYATPVVAALIGWAILGERLEPPAIIGFFIIFLGFVMIKSGEVSGLLQRA